MDKKYNQYSLHLKKLFGCKVYKVTLDAGFSCPNRDGSISHNGCIFCDEMGSFSRAHDRVLTLCQQLENGIKQLQERFKAEKFISYFQAFTNTYAPVEQLKRVYESALNHKDVVGLSIGTRPDCVDEGKIDLISSYAEQYYVWIEYGLQTIHNKTLKAINRGHSLEDFLKAVKITRNKKINIGVHVILGLPGESRDDMLETARFLADTGINGIKIHLLCVLENTQLEKMYNNGEIKLFSPDEYVELVCDFLEIIPPDVTIHRLAGSGLKEIHVAPDWVGEKFKILHKIDLELERRNSSQGRLYLK